MSIVTNGFFSSPLLSQIHRKSPKFTQNREFFTKDRGKDGICCAISESERVESKGKMEEYNTSMKRRMRNPYEYLHDLGMNYTIINENLIVGSQPQKPEDIDHLKHEEDVAYILCLQQDKDIEYWGIDFPAIMKRCKEVGIRHMRRPARDFDPDSLRGQLPKAVSSLEWAVWEGKGKVYVHCTAGLGRAPAVAIAYMFWFCDMNVITDNASNYKLAGKWLMEDKNIFWTPCAAHCVNLICQEIAAHTKVDAVVKECRTISVFIYNHTNVLHMMRKFTGNRNLLRPAVTRFATSFLSMESIFNQKAGLRTMIHSEDWTKSKWVTTTEGKRVTKIIKKSSFWNRLHFALKVLAPLVDVIRLVDMEEKPCMGYIYHAMEDCKKKIIANLGESNNGFLNEVLMIVDHRWVDQLHQPLHAAGYYLNLGIYFINQGERDSDLESNSAIKRGLFDAIKKLVSDVDRRDKIIDQLSVYRTARGMMGDPIAVRKRTTSAPVEWWITWGSEVPELQDFAKRVLGLTCAASPCERNWSAFNNLNTAYVTLTSKRPCGPNKKAIRGATYDLAKNDAWKEPFESLPDHAFGDIADWERKLIQDRVRGLRGS